MSSKWYHKWFRTPKELEAMGIAGINMRNAKYMLPNNPRRLYQRVDNKVLTKELAEAAGLDVPKTYLVVSSPGEVKSLAKRLAPHESFVMKPARGSGGKGILVIAHRDGENYVKPSGVHLTIDEVKHHASNILAGLHSLGGQRDQALIEYLVTPTDNLSAISYLGAPDIRIVMIHGFPVMAMLRAATKQSDGRANLHQGAIGIGVNLNTGKTVHAIHHGNPVTHHPDSKAPLIGIQIPNWDRMLEIATSCYEITELGYLGVDLMVDKDLGPIIIEINARPGLAIQMANGVGLIPRLNALMAFGEKHKDLTPPERMQISRELESTGAITPPKNEATSNLKLKT